MGILNIGGGKAFRREKTARGACLVLCLCLFGAYLHALDIQPLWWDEGVSVHLSRLSPAVILRPLPVTEDHPPGYYLLLSEWVTFFGTSPFGTRLLGVFSAVSLV